MTHVDLKYTSKYSAKLLYLCDITEMDLQQTILLIHLFIHLFIY